MKLRPSPLAVLRASLLEPSVFSPADLDFVCAPGQIASRCVSGGSSLRPARSTDTLESPHYHNVALKSGVLCLSEIDRGDSRR